MKDSISESIQRLIIILLLLSPYLLAQETEQESNFSIGIGNSLYNNIKTNQLIIFYKLNELSPNIGDFNINSDANLELISINSSRIMVVGFVPMLRYNLHIRNVNLFFSGGIGFNFLNNHNIGTRNLGGHFIFSDMISAGIKILDSDFMSIEMSYLIRHISNAGIFDSNEGFNSQYLVLSLIM
ncbi:acyloxyacyl hydrolase [Ignavibacterium sp.]|uniref:acyloxyacyl hydrolase n=1 Tax=Ignavibacterium sp. TaxID=2651167 RepID=UPI00307CD29B